MEVRTKAAKMTGLQESHAALQDMFQSARLPYSKQTVDTQTHIHARARTHTHTHTTPTDRQKETHKYLHTDRWTDRQTDAGCMAEEEEYLSEEVVPEQLRCRVDNVTVPRCHNVVRLLGMAGILKVCQLQQARQVSRRFVGTGGRTGGRGGRRTGQGPRGGWAGGCRYLASA